MVYKLPVWRPTRWPWTLQRKAPPEAEAGEEPMLLRSNLTPGEVAQRCKARKKWRPYTYLNGVSVCLRFVDTSQTCCMVGQI